MPTTRSQTRRSASAVDEESSRNRQGALPAEPKHRADVAEAENERQQQEKLRVNQSGIDVENMTAELETRQPLSPTVRKSTERPPIQTRQAPMSKGKRKAQDTPEPQERSSLKRKQDGDFYSMPNSSEDEGDAHGNGKSMPSRRPIKQRKMDDTTKPTPQPELMIIPAKRGRGRPPKNAVYIQPVFQDEPAAPAHNEPEEEVGDSDAGIPAVRNIGQVSPKRAQQIQEDDEDDAHNGPTSAQQTNEVDEDDVEDDGECFDVDGGGAEDDSIGEILLPPSSAEARPPTSCEKLRDSARNARAVGSNDNHAGASHGERVRRPQDQPGHREYVVRQVREELGEAAAHVGEVPEVAASDDSEEEEDVQALAPKLAVWKGIIGLDFFPEIKTISSHLGRKMNGGEWEIITPMSRGSRSVPGKEMNGFLKKLLEHYQDLEHAIDEYNETDQVKAKSDINQTIEELKVMMENALPPLDDNASVPRRIKRRFLKDLYFTLVPSFLRVLKSAVLTYGKLGMLVDEDLTSVINISKAILGLFDDLEKQELQLMEWGQTKQPLRELRPLLRDELLRGCQKELRRRKQAEEEKERAARIEQRRRDREAEYKREEDERRKNARKIREYNERLMTRAMKNPEMERQINEEMKQIEYQRLPQEKRVQEILGRKYARRVHQARRQSTREDSAARLYRSFYAGDETGSNDPFSNAYVVPPASQRQRTSNNAPVRPLAPSPSPPLFLSPKLQQLESPAAPPDFHDISQEGQQIFYEHFREKYRHEQEGIVDPDSWRRLQGHLEGGRYTLDDIFGFARELQVALDFEHENGRLVGDAWTYRVWEEE
ncbi:hypothetical protein DSL72_007004 [Monilinia vaccinii-corymbosi]|uniref:Uncharacterized protein n=1 Tax=Monilinia vaccinii-corymbosi TaxID=61207 RepID=A0A8A3PKI2_9HELO|nr:hypothetical protein DSL72_007004 [Monilinia vaccinii-corymbosi]